MIFMEGFNQNNLEGMVKIMKRKLVSVLLAAVMTVTVITGCEGQKTSETGKVSEKNTASPDGEKKEYLGQGTVGGQWYASTIQGAVTKETKVSLKDDYYTAANLDYISGLTIESGYSSAGVFKDADQIMRERTIGLLQKENPQNHDEELVSGLYELALDWEGRNKTGLEPVKEIVEQIQAIRTIDDLTEYEKNGVNGFGVTLSQFQVENSLANPGNYTVGIDTTALFLGDAQEYSELSESGKLDEAYYNKRVHYMLERLGFSEEEADRVWTDCNAFETAIAEHMMTLEERYADDVYEKIINTYTRKELSKLQGNYPILEVLQAYGMDGSDRYNLYEPEWLSGLAGLYTEENVEMIKHYFLAHFVSNIAEQLDRETYEAMQEYQNEKDGITGTKSEEELGLDAVDQYLTDVLDYVYIDAYCSAEERQSVIDMIQEFQGYYHKMLEQEDWLTEETRQRAMEKLDHITIRACYSDTREDYSKLAFSSKEEGGSYWDALQKIAKYRLSLQQAKINQKVNTDLFEMSTRQVNAYYEPLDNSINILCGTLVGAFSLDQPYEAVLATVGAQTIGHEISHAFDTSGAQFDKDGKYDNWWEEADYSAFNERADRLVEYMNQIIPYEKSQAVNGELEKGEMIADLGGMKAALMMAQDRKDFDYEKFFQAAAKGWALIYTENRVISQLQTDPHPLANLRVNIPLQNSDEFMETYDIQPGDGMYMAEEDRVSVW